MVCYMVVTPNPSNGQWAMHNFKKGFWVKFGDGQFRPSYGTDNPDHRGVENRKHTDEAIYRPSITGRGIRSRMAVRLGKALEWQYLQGWKVSHSEREWHFIAEHRDLPLETLRQYIMQAMRLFPALLLLEDLDMRNNAESRQFAGIMERVEDHVV